MEIENKIILEFFFEEFFIRYDFDEEIWYAEHFDEETYPDRIVIEDVSFINETMVIFGYCLSKEKFNQFKEILEKEKKNVF